MASNMPAAEFEVTAGLVRALLRQQHPDLAALELSPLAFGWDNVLYRLGDDLLVRLPRRQLGADLVAGEQRWLPVLAPRLPLPIPAPVRVGRPGLGYPWPWSVVPYVEGASAAEVPLADPGREAERLGRFLSALHQPAPPDAPVNEWRGVPLARRAERFAQAVAMAADRAGEAQRCWERAVGAQVWDGPPLWLHGDLHPANVLVRDGELCSVIDFGDLCGGDPATDLAVTWMLFDPVDRARCWSAYGASDEALVARARGWALALSLVYLASSADHPVLAAIGHRTLDAVLADA